ncbi:MAG: ATP-dependent DNA helicase [Deltaproteobacteria bacterium]|jgi:ATP-dependent DNA helicase DinG|nr:ATP-dependent DNA helicase [Deltaproteobacteria bacterium]
MNDSQTVPATGRIPLPSGFPEDIGDLDFILSKGGALDRRWDGFQPRHAQLKMFREAARAFRSGDISIIEAGTGTGKTLAYLLPAIISGKKTVISTCHKNLQEQIFLKDLEFIREHFEVTFSSAILKGRDNYLCLKRYHSEISKRSQWLSRGEQSRIRMLKEWKENTATGELEELPYVLRKEPPFDRLSSEPDACSGKNCRFSAHCFIAGARAKAAEADIILVNHHLFMADLTLRDESAAVLPEWEAAVIDEAHMLEEIAIIFFTKRFSTAELQNVCYDLSRLLDRALESPASGGAGSELVQTVLELREKAENIQEAAARINTSFQGLQEEEILWPAGPSDGWPQKHRELKAALLSLRGELEDLARKAAKLGDLDEDFQPVHRRLDATAENVLFIASNSEPSYVYTVQAKGDDVLLSAVPVNVSEYLRDRLFTSSKTVLLTSATLAVGDSLKYFCRKIGIHEPIGGLVLQSPFDFWNRTVLYIPAHIPIPVYENGYDAFGKAIAEELPRLLEITRGRALVLFTTKRLMDSTYAAIQGRVRWPLYKQGDASRTDTLNAFREDTGSVLLATRSFWQGVDVPGASLTAVIIDKLPFPPFNDPLSKARERLTAESGRDRFRDYSLPEMKISLKQGLGRLLRSASDWGLLAVLDNRLRTKPYGTQILKEIQHGPIKTRLEDVAEFFERMEGAGAPRGGS